MCKNESDDKHTDEEAQRRFKATLKRMLSTPPKPHTEMKIGKRKAKASQKESRPEKGVKPKDPTNAQK